MAIKFRERCIFSQKYLNEMHAKIHNKSVVSTAERELHEDLIDEEQLEYIDEEVQILEDNYEIPQDDVTEELVDEEFVEETDDAEEEDTEEQMNKEKRHWVLLEDNRPTKRLRNFFICEECGEYFNDEDEYNEHAKGHVQHKESKRFFPCYKCPANFNTKIALKIHRQEQHSGDRLFKCSTCGETFLQHSAKQRHEK